jgi:hypothetical protein
MKPFIMAITLPLLAAIAGAKPVKFDGGCFAVTLNVDPEDWRIENWPQLNFIQFQKTGGVGLFGGAAFEAFVFVDRISDATVPADLQKWFAEYLQRKTGFLHDKIFDQPRRFRAAKKSPTMLSGKSVICFEMVPKPLSRPASRTQVEEEGVVYFLILPEFEKHKTFFVFTGRQVLSRDLGQRSELGEVQNIINGFELTLSKKG